jgi:hypothetical protein
MNNLVIDLDSADQSPVFLDLSPFLIGVVWSIAPSLLDFFPPRIGFCELFRRKGARRMVKSLAVQGSALKFGLDDGGKVAAATPTDVRETTAFEVTVGDGDKLGPEVLEVEVGDISPGRLHRRLK